MTSNETTQIDVWREQMQFRLVVDDDDTSKMEIETVKINAGDMFGRSLSLVGRGDNLDHVSAIVVWGCTQLEADTRAAMLASAWSAEFKRRKAARKARRSTGRAEVESELLAEARGRLALYDAAARKFIAKVESGRARSHETYADLKAALDGARS